MQLHRGIHSFGQAFLLSTLVVVASISAPGANVNGPDIAKAAPPLNLSVLQAPADASVKWAALQGKVVVIDFWATWCGPCRKSIPHWNEVADTFQGKQVQFLAITDENEQVVAAFLKRSPIHSWVGLDGVGQSMRDAYNIHGIPTTVIVNQAGVVVAVTHPARLQPKDIQEVMDTGKSSLPPPVEEGPAPDAAGQGFERVPATQPTNEVSVHPSGPVPAGHGFDCWEASSASADASGQYASVKQAILTLFDGREMLLDCRTTLPAERYDFVVRLPPGASHADREQAVAPMFRSVFGLQIQRVQAEREVYVLKAASTNAPGLTPPTPSSKGGGGEERGGLKLGRAQIEWLPGYFEKWLRRPVINETGLTNRYDIRLKWKMSKRELVLVAVDSEVFFVAEEPNAEKEEKLSSDQRRQLAAIRGKLTEAELQTFPAEDRENFQLLRAELAKPEDERFLPDPETVSAAIREQLGLELSIQRRSMPVLEVEKAGVVP